MNTTTAPFDDVKVRQAVNYAVDPEALERIYAGQIAPSQQILPRGMPGYKKFELYPHDMAKARQLIAEAHPADRSVTVWSDDESPNNEAAEYYEGVLEKLGFDATLKIVNADNYFTIVSNTSTPELDTGLGNWFEDYPTPTTSSAPALRRKHPADQQHQLGADRRPEAERRDRPARSPTARPKQEGEYAQLDRSFMEQAPWAPYGNLTVATFVSSAIDLDKVIFNPTFGQDLTSFQFK